MEDRPEQTQSLKGLHKTGYPEGTEVAECPLMEAAGHDHVPGWELDHNQAGLWRGGADFVKGL